MDQRPNVSLNNSAKPSKPIALIALVIAIALPFLLVKSFPHKQKANYDHYQQPHENQVTSQIPPVKSPAVQPTVVVKPSPPAVSAAAKAPVPDPVKVATNPPLTVKVLTPPKDVVENKSILTRRSDSLAAVFSRIGLKRQLLQTIARENSRIKPLARLMPNEQLQYQLKNHELERMNIPLTDRQSLILYRDGNHYRTKINAYAITTKNLFVTATVHGSLFTTAKRHNIPSKLINQMTEIFAWDINFTRDVRANDQFTILYKTTYANNKLIGTGEIAAVTYKNRGKTFQAILHTSRSGHSDYYSPKGESLKNAFNRYPLRFSHISSTFSLSRNHPILRYKRPHKGVDLAAPIGTPILATGDGRIEVIGRQSGYGNMIKIKHNGTYSSIYGHMLRFQKGLSRGSFVKRGQVIGFVGQTGLASGPHCHYEFHVKHQPRNPTTVSLPRGDSVPSREIASFRANSNRLLAQMKSFETTRYATANKKNTKVG